MSLPGMLLNRLNVRPPPTGTPHRSRVLAAHVTRAMLSALRTRLATIARRVTPARLLLERKARWVARQNDPAIWPVPAVRQRPGIQAYEYALFSQNGEDGVLRYLFDEIGFESRRFLEFGFSAFENNSLRLILRDHFSGVFLDGSDAEVRTFQAFADRAGVGRAQAVRTWLTRENIAAIVRDAGVSPDLDLLSIDVDGNDYWFAAELLPVLRPRILLVEYNASFGPTAAVSVPYDPAFERYAQHPTGFYHSASLTAFADLGRRHGYALVGCDSRGINAFFVRADCLRGSLCDIAPADAFRPHAGRVAVGFSTDDQMQMIRDRPIVECTRIP